MMKRLYGALISLHPPAFRRQFGPEMEWIFEESCGPPRLMIDGIISLARQWVLRTQLWIFGIAALGGVIPFALGFGIIRLALPHRQLRRPVAQALSQPVTAPLLILTAVILLMFISGTMIFAVTWFRYSQRGRRV